MISIDGWIVHDNALNADSWIVHDNAMNADSPISTPMKRVDAGDYAKNIPRMSAENKASAPSVSAGISVMQNEFNDTLSGTGTGLLHQTPSGVNG